MRRFHLFQLWFLLPGVALVVASVYIPLSYLHKQIFWTETEALTNNRVERDDGMGGLVYYSMTFADEGGTTHYIDPNSDDTFMEGKDSNHVRIYYDPSNPEAYELVNHGRYLLILFLPFALLLCYLGWPDRERG
jgi:hypothetical protein